jgi:signal transduction histidine kinase
MYNAIKYTERGFITITVDMIHYDDILNSDSEESDNDSKNQTIRFKISDTGVGIPKEKFNNLLSIDGNTMNIQYIGNDSQQATRLAGLGLSISEKILQQFNSHLHHSSFVNQGSSFWFDIHIIRNEQSVLIPRKKKRNENFKILKKLISDEKKPNLDK